MRNVDPRLDRTIIAHLSEMQRAMGDAGMAYISGGNVVGHLRRVRAELEKIEEQIKTQRNRDHDGTGMGVVRHPAFTSVAHGLDALRHDDVMNCGYGA